MTEMDKYFAENTLYSVNHNMRFLGRGIFNINICGDRREREYVIKEDLTTHHIVYIPVINGEYDYSGAFSRMSNMSRELDPQLVKKLY